MSVTLTHSPADILRWLLVSLGAGSAPSSSSDWPIFATQEPDRPDNCITVFDTAGVLDGRQMPTGVQMEHEGWQIRIRARTHNVGWQKAKEIADLLDQSVVRYVVVIGGHQYLVQCVSRTSGVLSLGEESPQTKRRVFTLNGIMAVREI